MQSNLVQKQAKYFLALLVVYSIVYPFYGLGGLLNYSFFTPDLMIENQFTDGNVNAAMRWKHFIAWLPANITGISACLCGVYLSYLAHNGKFFTVKFSHGLWYLGLSVLLTGFFDLFGASVVPYILSSLNPNGQEPVHFHFSPEELGLGLCGIGFMALGRMMHEATRLSEESKGFV